jgi:hypothetical protein
MQQVDWVGRLLEIICLAVIQIEFTPIAHGGVVSTVVEGLTPQIRIQ